MQNNPVQLNEGIRLLSGDLFNYNNPEASNVEIDDIASALSNVCRFAGHLRYFYSVAQHSVNVSRIVPEHLAFDALMHDTAEAFTNDLPTPLKAAFPVFKELEVRIESAMAKRFGFNFPMDPAIKKADLQMLKLEKERIKGDKSQWECLNGIETDDVAHLVDLRMFTPPQAKKLFMARFEELNGKRNERLRRKAAA